MSKTSSNDSAEDQHADNDEQPPPEQHTVGPTEDSEEKEDCGPSSVKLPSGISNTGPSQSSEPHKQEITSNDSPDGGIVPEAEEGAAQKDQPNLSELVKVMERVLDVLQDSTIASRSGKEHCSRFWGVYTRVAEEHDGEFLERYTSDMDIVLVFSGLFSAVSTSFIVAMEANLSPNPSDTTNVLLTQLVQIGLGNLTAAAAPESPWSPPTSTIRIQMIAYASLSMSLLAAFGAVLGKQWLGYYKSNRYGRGSPEERGKRRQEKFDGIIAWYFDAVVQSFPVLLQISLLLFGIALSANMWYEQCSIVYVIIATTVFGFLFYSLTVMACLISPSCPFQTPISTILRLLRIDKVLLLKFKRATRHFRRLATSAHSVLQRLIGTLRSRWTRLSEALRGPVPSAGVDSEAQPFDQNLDVLAENVSGLQVALYLPDVPTGNLEAPSIKWLLETSTDPEVFLAAARIVPQVEWPLDLDVSGMLPQLYDIFTSCVDIQSKIIPSLEDKASACTLALSHLYCGRVLQAYPGRGEFLGRGRRDLHMFFQMTPGGMCIADDTILTTTTNLCLMEDYEENVFLRFPIGLQDCSDYIPEWLSHVLPYHFVTGRVNEEGEKLAITVISKLLCSPSSPSTQIVANCTLLACVMVGVQVDKKYIVRLDKSSALRQLAESLLTQFQKALWTCDGGNINSDSTAVARRAWNLLDVICRILELAGDYKYSPHTMRNLDVCRKVYSRARSSEQSDPSVSLAALPKVLHFTFAAAMVSRDHDELWSAWFRQMDSHSAEDCDWLVDYLDYIYIRSGDHEIIYDILLLLGSITVHCSPAKQHVFVERLISCMDSNMPDHLRHATLRAAHSAREDMASIDAMDDVIRDMVLTKLSPAIMSVVCPLPGAAPANDDPHRSFDRPRDLCYLELVFALARNSDWHPHLCGDHHIDQCISLIAEYCKSDNKLAFYIAGILLRIAPEQMVVTSFNSVTEQQWWDVMRRAWFGAYFATPDNHYFESLPVLVESTKRYMQIASKSDLEQLIGDVDDVLSILEAQAPQGEGVGIAAVKDLRAVARDMLERFGQ